MDVTGKTIAVTHAGRFMGPALQSGLKDAGAHVIASDESLTDVDSVRRFAEQCADADVLVVNLAYPRPDRFAHELEEEDIAPLFEALVYPLMRLGRELLPGMYSRGSGKVVVAGSAAPLRAFAKSASYAAARAAQHAWVRSTAVEAAPRGVQVNATAQIFVENPEYFPDAYQQTDEFKQRLLSVPAGRLGTAQESVDLVRYLASDASDFLSGTVIPLTGGWSA